jgi:putative peptidoglycan binding protein
MIVALFLVGGASAWAQNGAVGMGGPATTAPPPSSVTMPPTAQGVPPTPAPAFPGLPSPTVGGALPSSQGFDARTANELRPSGALNVTQVGQVQSALASAGLYRGPIDGNMTASLRASLRQYQALSAIPQTGDIDAETMARLQRSALSGNVGSSGTTSTTGNRGAAGDPFSTSSPPAPLAPSTNGQSGTATFSTPFQLSAPINTSPATGQTATVQP